MKIIGFGGGSKGGSSGGGISEDADNLASVQNARIVDLIGEGEIEGLVSGEQSIFLDGTPLRNNDGTYNFKNVVWDFRTGTQAQSAMPAFNEVASEVQVATKVYHGTPVVRAITQANVSAVVVTVSLSGLTYTDNSGGIHGSTVEYAIDVSYGSGAYAQVGSYTITGKTRSTYYKSTRIEVSGVTPISIRVRRITDDSTSSLLINDLYFSTYSVISSYRLNYPNSALAGLQVDARYFDHVPTRSYHVKGMRVRVPANYNPLTRVYTGTWDGTWKIAYTNNPAWCFLDLVTSTRYGLGKRISLAQLDKWALYTIAQYCDQFVPTGYTSNTAVSLNGSQISTSAGTAWIASALGGSIAQSYGATKLYEPRFTLNCVLNTREDAYKVLNNLASVFRGMIYWGTGGAVGFSQDAPAKPQFLYNSANVIDGRFTYAGSAKAHRHTVALVSWNDPAQNFRQVVEYVEDAEGIARYGINQTEVVAFGCTSQGQARRYGLWLLYTERLQTEVCTFQVSLDSLYVRPGMTCQIADPNRAGKRMGGRFVSATTTSAELDAPVVFDASMSYTMSVVDPTNGVLTRTLVSQTGSHASVSWLSPLPSAPAPGTIFVLSATNLTPQTFRVISVKDLSKNTFEIAALEQNDSKYNAVELGLHLDIPPTTSIDLTPVAPTNLVVVENSYRPTRNGQTVTSMEISWTGSSAASTAGYIVTTYLEGQPKSYAMQTACSMDISGIVAGSYSVQVVTVNALGIQSAPATATITLTGLDTTPPGDVGGLTCVIDPASGVILNWNLVDSYVAYYEVRRGASWGTSSLVNQVSATSLNCGYAPKGVNTYWIKAVDNSGNYSVNATSVSITVQGANPPVVYARLSGASMLLSWGVQHGSFNTSDYEVRYGPSFAGSTHLAFVGGTSYATPVDFGGSRTFWVVARDGAGNVGNEGSTQITITPPSTPTITSQVIDNNVLLYWTDCTQSLPIDTYEIRRGTSWVTAEPIGTKSGLFTTIFETVAATYTYWVAGIDSAGNIGTPGRLTVPVNAPPDYILKYDYFSIFNGTLNNAVMVGANLTFPINTSETFSQHFTTNGWGSASDQIAAGYPVYVQPTPASGYYEEVIDYGTTLPNIGISVYPTYSIVSGSPSVSTTISVSNTSESGPWTDYPNTNVVYAAGFRWVKVRITATSSDGKGVVQMSALEFKLATKLKNDGGTATVSAGDSGGTTVNFNVPFIDVTSITLTPQGTSPRTAIFDFSWAPNETHFKVLMFDSSGARVSGSVSWSVKGY